MKTPGARQFVRYLLDERQRQQLGPFAAAKGRRHRQAVKKAKPAPTTPKTAPTDTTK